MPAAPILDSLPPLASLIRAGDAIIIGQAGAEPLTLTRALVEEADSLAGPVDVFLGAVLSDTFARPLSPKLRPGGYGIMGGAAKGFASQPGSIANVTPTPYRELERSFSTGRLRADVVMLQLAPSADGSRLSLGMANDYVIAAARRARCVIAEINPQAPFTPSTEADAASLRIDVAVRAATSTVQSPTMAAEEAERRIAGHVASVVPDRAPIQIGLGALPDAVLGLLASHRDLGLHSGLIGDSAVALIESGAVTNAYKGLDNGFTVTNTLGGTTRAHRHAHDNPQFLIRPATYTHHPATLAALHRFHAINSALEVDVTGQANAEHDGRAWRGGLGGLGDFVRTARLSEGGRGIVALASTSRDGKRSRIVAGTSRGQVTLGRGDADLVITEWGVADLRDASFGERASRMIAIADPRFREQLERDWHALRGA
ncbi:MAG: acetyl-CoA hydrolase/transferase family protein [Burkholderiaceae bacterium]